MRNLFDEIVEALGMIAFAGIVVISFWLILHLTPDQRTAECDALAEEFAQLERGAI